VRADRSNFLEGTVLHGISLLYKVIFEIKDHDALVTTMQRHIVSSCLPFNALDGMLGDAKQAIRPYEDPCERDRMQEKRAPFPFRGDDEPDALPLGWTMIWGGTYSNLFGWYISDDLRQIGYVFWDAATLEAVGGRNAKEAVQLLWEKAWGDEDPRDTLF
jgi:hypothetical protein